MTTREKIELVEITREEFEKMLTDYGHHMNVTVPVKEAHDEVADRTVLNNGMVYSPYAGSKQIGMSNNKKNAKSAMKYIRGEAKLYSSVFHHTTGYYRLID